MQWLYLIYDPNDLDFFFFLPPPPPLGWERLAQDCDKCLQRRKRKHIQSCFRGRLHVWRCDCTLNVPIEVKDHVPITLDRNVALIHDITYSALYVVLSSWQYGLGSKPCHVLWARLSGPLLKPVNKNAFEYFNHWIRWLWRGSTLWNGNMTYWYLSPVDSLCKRSNHYSRLYRNLMGIFFFFFCDKLHFPDL